MGSLVPLDAVAIGIGATFGALARQQAGRIASDWIATDPNRLGKITGWHTAGINIGGSFLLGAISATPLVTEPKSVKPPYFPKFEGMSPRTKLMLGVGFCGSFTTFSTYSVDVVNWIAQGNTTRALSYVATNNVGGIVAAACGMALVKKLRG
eukprot:scaffold2816_cov121-Cylindrotheca_fusiformis.AAC.14